MSDPSVQSKVIDAAAKASVPYVLTCEFGSDSANEKLLQEVSIMQAKAQYRQQVEDLGVSSWVGIVNNPWLDFSLLNGNFGIKLGERKARIWGDGKFQSDTTTTDRVGEAVAGLLSLPEDELSQYRNAWVYMSSFCVSQQELLNSVVRATGTNIKDWDIEYVDVAEAMENAKARVRSGDFMAVVDHLYGTMFREGYGGDYSKHKPLINDVLHLPKEDLDQTVKSIIDKAA